MKLNIGKQMDYLTNEMYRQLVQYLETFYFNDLERKIFNLDPMRMTQTVVYGIPDEIFEEALYLIVREHIKEIMEYIIRTP